MSRKTSVTRAALCLFVAVATAPLTFSQVTITGTGAGAFKCTEGGDPLLGIALTDYVWCDSSHTFVMNNNNAADPSDLFPPGKSITSVAGLVDSQSDNSIFSSPVDGNGNPSFLGVNGTGHITITATAAAPLIVNIMGRKEIVSGTLTATNAVSASTVYFVYLTLDTGTPLNTDIGWTTLPPVYRRAPPTCTTGQFWFDVKTRLMKMCSGAMFVANTTSRVIFLGVVATNAGATGTFGIAHEPWGLDSLTRLHEFGDGSGLYPATSGTTLDGQQYLPALEITSGSLTQNSISVTNPPLVIFSQNPVLITNTGTINLNLKGRPGASGGNTAGAGGNSCGFGGSGGGGGGGGTTGVQGGSGGGHSSFFAYATSNGGNGGIAGNGAGGTGSGYSAILDLRGVYIIGGCGGGSGGGDLTTKLGGAGGQGGGGIYLKAPSIVINTSTNPSANGDVGGAPSGCSTGKCGGGGGGAGGTFILDGYFVENSATIHVDGGAGAAPVGTAGAGGAGGAGVVQIIERQ